MQPQHKKAILLAIAGLSMLLLGYVMGKNLEGWVDQRESRTDQIRSV